MGVLSDVEFLEYVNVINQHCQLKLRATVFDYSFLLPNDNCGVDIKAQTLLMGNVLLNRLESKEEAFCLLAHEATHVIEQHRGTSLENEIRADLGAHRICKALGLNLVLCSKLLDRWMEVSCDYYPPHAIRKHMIITGEYIQENFNINTL